MTENLAGRGEGLAGAIACVKEFIAWATEQIGTSEAHGCAEQAEDALKLLEATAPAGTAQLARQMLDLVELYVVGDDGNYHAPSNYMTPEQWTALVIGLEEAALATLSPQAPERLCDYVPAKEKWHCVRPYMHRGDHSPFVVDAENADSPYAAREKFEYVCPRCSGTGGFGGLQCPDCKGEKKLIGLRVPAATQEPAG